jgi:EAL domain-containing protein (putative c-di-GMP-specific phosphodiesterase class I)
VLVVDDDPLVLESYCRVLEKAGYQVLCAEDGRTAFEISSQQPLDAVVSDIAMPGMTGVQLMEAIRNHDVDVPVVLTTGKPTLETAVRAVGLGAAAYLTKPVAVQELRDAVSRVVSARTSSKPPSGLRSAPLVQPADHTLFDDGLQKLWVAFQPVCRAGDGTVFGYEGLLRSDHPPVRSPLAFLEVAERIGKVWALGRAVRDEIARRAEESLRGSHLFVNVSPNELLDPHLYSAESALSRIAPRVVIEITERASLDRIEDVSQRIQRLRELGFRIAVDDLGAGYSSLSALVALEPEVVKLDMSLVRDVHASARKRALIRSLIQASSEFGAVVVAEGVEIPEEREILVEVGCDLLQGYLLGRPARLS